MTTNEPQSTNLKPVDVIDSELAQQTSYADGAVGFTAMPYDGEDSLPPQPGPIVKPTVDMDPTWFTRGIGPVEPSHDDRLKGARTEVTEANPFKAALDQAREIEAAEIAEAANARTTVAKPDKPAKRRIAGGTSITTRPTTGPVTKNIRRADEQNQLATPEWSLDYQDIQKVREANSWTVPGLRKVGSEKTGTTHNTPERSVKDKGNLRRHIGAALLAAAILGGAIGYETKLDVPEDTGSKKVLDVPTPQPKPTNEPKAKDPFAGMTPEQIAQFEQMVADQNQLQAETAAQNPDLSPREVAIRADEQWRQDVDRVQDQNPNP